MTLNRKDYKLVETCSACPEQYDVFVNGQQVGYLRLRHGHFSVSYPDHYGETIYSASPRGDGIFEPEERNFYLNEAIKAIDRRHHSSGDDNNPEDNMEADGWTFD